MSDEERPGQRVRPEEWEGLGRGGFDDNLDEEDVDGDDGCSCSDGGAAARVRHFKSNV